MSLGEIENSYATTAEGIEDAAEAVKPPKMCPKCGAEMKVLKSGWICLNMLYGSGAGRCDHFEVKHA